MRWHRVLSGSMVVALVAVLGACSSGDDVATADCTVIAPTEPGRTVVTIEAKNMQFVQRCVQVEPGTLVVQFENNDDGTGHNFHLSGNGVNEATDLIKGPDSAVLELELPETGEYGFTCDPHPNMTGKVVVAEATNDTPTTA